MTRKRSFDRKIQEAIALGEENRDLIRQLEPWCKHIRVELRTFGIVAQYTGLPAGMLEVVCPHATKGSMQGANVRQLAAGFVESNCRNCPHHHELNPNNLGRRILSTVDSIRNEEAAAPPPASEARQRLRAMVSADLSKALQTAPTTQQSVLECVALLENEKEAARAAEILVAAAEIGSDLFPPVAITVIAEFLGDIRCGSDCARTLRVLGKKAGGLAPAAIDSAHRQLAAGFCHDEVLELLADHYASAPALPNLGTVSKLFELHGWSSLGTMHSEPEAGPGQIRLLGMIAHRDPKLVADAANRLLSSINERLQTAAAVTIEDLVPLCPAVGPMVLLGVLLALKEGHDEYGTTEAHLRDAAAEVYFLDPAGTQKTLDATLAASDGEGQAAIVGIYERIWREAQYGHPSSPKTAAARKTLQPVIDAALATVSNRNISLDARGEAADSLAKIADDFPGLVQPKLTSLFGVLAVVSQEHCAFQFANPGGDPELPGFPRAERGKYDRIIGHLVKALESLAEFVPEESLTCAQELYDGLRSDEPTQAETKRLLVRIAEALTSNDAAALKLIPWIYKAMMDPESTSVRVQALDVIGRLLRHSNDLVPENMREMLLVYTGDRLVAVRHAAVQAVRGLQPDDLAEAKRILVGMLQLHHHYASEKHHQSERTDTSEAILGLCRKFPSLLSYAIGVLVQEVRTGDEYGGADALRDWDWALKDIPSTRGIFVRELLGFLAKHPLDTDDIHNRSGVFDRVLTLYEAAKGDIEANRAKFLPAIEGASRNHSYAALQLIAVLIHFELFAEAAEAAEVVGRGIPAGSHQQFLKDQLALVQVASTAEAKVYAGEPVEALRLLNAEQTRLQRYEKGSRPDEPEAAIKALSLAYKVAQRLS